MASIALIKTAKEVFNEHCTNHRCRTGECDTRKQLWLAYMREAERWGGYRPLRDAGADQDVELLRGLL